MGKSPAKWFKSVLLGKKGPKAKVAKGNEKVSNEGEGLVVGKTTERNLATTTIASHLSDADSVQENLEMDNKEVESSQQIGDMPELERDMAGLLVALNSPARCELDQSATKIQASFRGYLARRAYLALKGIIKLQALLRGHLVRRQAVSTVHCMLGIVKLQAHVRGKIVRLSDIGLQSQGKVIFQTIWERKLVNADEGNYGLAKKLPANVLSRKFLVSSPKPLHLQYDATNPNSVTSWLDRWSVSKFWKPVPTKPNGSTGQDQNQITRSVKTEMSRTKRDNKLLPSARVDNGSTLSSFDVERSRRTFRKPSIHSVEISDPEAAKSELEKVKRSLRKVHESAFPPAAEDDKPKKSSNNIIATSVQQVPEQTNGVAPEKITQNPYGTLPTLVDVEASGEQQEGTDTSDTLLNLQTNADTKQSDKITEDEKILTENEGSPVKQDMLDNENQKVSVKESFQANNESPQNGSNKQPKVPSYMLATKSAKAKLRDSSALLEHEAPEKIPSSRRHSLPSATGTKVTPSPKTQKLTPSIGKTKNKREKSLTASKDGSGKSGWRR